MAIEGEWAASATVRPTAGQAMSGGRSLERKIYGRPVRPAEFRRHFITGPLGKECRARLQERTIHGQDAAAQQALKLLDVLEKKYRNDVRGKAHRGTDDVVCISFEDIVEHSSWNRNFDRITSRLDTAIADCSRGRFRLKPISHLREGTYTTELQAYQCTALARRRTVRRRPSETRVTVDPRKYDCFLLEDSVHPPQRPRVAFVAYPPLSTRPGIDPEADAGLYNRLFSRLPIDSSSEPELRHATSLGDALRLLRISDEEAGAVDCVFGILDTPRRAFGLGVADPEGRNEYYDLAVPGSPAPIVFLSPLHLISVVGVTHSASELRVLSDVLDNKAVRLYCIKSESGEEFLTRSLGILEATGNYRFESHPAPTNDIGSVLRQITEPSPAGQGVAFLDAVSAFEYIRRNKNCNLDIRLKSLAWYSCGIMFRKRFANLHDVWLENLRKLRLEEWKGEQEELGKLREKLGVDFSPRDVGNEPRERVAAMMALDLIRPVFFRQ